jgi:hypothetical protein
MDNKEPIEATECPTNVEELVAYIEQQRLIVSEAGTGEKGYEAAAVFAARVAIAAFNLAECEQELSGHQASWASLEFLRVVRDIKGPFAILEAKRMMWPQYASPVGYAREMETSWARWAAEEAKRLLSEEGDAVGASVREHWRKLAAFEEVEP